MKPVSKSLFPSLRFRLGFYCFIFFLSFQSAAQSGKDGGRTISSAGVILNEYTSVTSPVPVGSTTISVTSSNLNTNNRFAAPLNTGDLIMIIQLQGATITHPDDTTYGSILAYNDCGNHELCQVAGVVNATTISLSCATKYSYTPSGKVQVVRVPRYTTLDILAGGSVTCPGWDGTTGGVVVVECDGNITINAGGSITATGKGFRGGQMNENLAFYGVGNDVWPTGDYGGEKGEGIAGYQADYDLIGGRYCKGAPANGGGGANSHNAGGGGGANAASLPWTGRGNPDPAYPAAWNLEYSGFATSVSGGGGKGGYTFSSSNQNEQTMGPLNTAWGGDYRRENGGRGGRPLDYSTGRIFFGGGGGSGDQNDSKGGSGGNGGGLIFITTRGAISGTGTISSDGNNGVNSATPPLFNTSADGAGGGGAGGTVLLDARGAITGISITASGGKGGNQNVASGSLDAYGPGGGGGGGYIALTNGAVARTAIGGMNGTTNSFSINTFPPNGATSGGSGLPNETLPTFSFSCTVDTICPNTAATLIVNYTGALPAGTIFNWYTSPTSPSIGSGNSFVTPPLTSTTTYYVGTCPGFYRIPVQVVVGSLSVTFTPPSICSGDVATLNGQAMTFPGTVVNWTWNYGDGTPTGSGQNTTHQYASSGTFIVTLTVTNSEGCQASYSSNITVQPTPQINFSVSATTGCTPLNVVFTNTTTGANGSYFWNFGDGGTSVVSSPGHSYTAPGSYTVYLVAVNGNCSDTLTRSAYITVNPKPTAAFTPSQTLLCLGDTVFFTNASVGNGNPITGYVWNFGDGTPVSNQSSPYHVYASAGAFQVRLITSAAGCTDDSVITVNVGSPPTVAFSTATTTGCGPTAVAFTNTTTGNPSFVWNFGDGSGISTAVSPTHTYVANGIYTVTLIAAQGSCSDTLVRPAFISIYPKPISSFSTSNVCFGDTVRFTNLSSISGGTITGYSWNYGDGTPNGTTLNPVHYYSAVGTYQVRLTVSTANCSDDTVITVNVNPSPIASFATSATTSCGPTTISFTNTTTGSAGYVWSFGDGSSSTLANPAHTYTTSGVFTVTLVATQGSCVNTLIRPNLIIISPKPLSSFTTSNVCFGDTVRFNNLSSVSGALITGYSWDFGDGSPLATSPNANHFYASPGSYQVQLTVSTAACTDDTVLTVTVSPSPTAGFTSSISSSCGPTTVTFVNSTTGTASYLWNFGDGSPSSGLAAPTHTYTSSGTYPITLVATDGSCSDTLVRPAAITIHPLPISSFSASAVCFGDTVHFSNQTLANGAVLTGYTWDFGDGSTSTVSSSPSHYYASPGTYQVRLTVSSAFCTDDTVVTVTVNPSPVAGFSSALTSSCGPAIISFTNSSTASPVFTWNFGDGSAVSNATTPTHTYSSVGTYSVTLIATQGSCSDTLIRSNYITIQPQPISQFSAADVCSGDSVHFLNSSIGGPLTSTLWDFGDGTNAGLYSPVHYYSNSGAYPVRLTVAIAGCVDDTIITINVSAAPQAQISASVVSGCSPLQVVFSNTTIGNASYYWDFDDGTSSSAQQPVHTFSSGGTYAVELIASLGSCSDTANSTIMVSNAPVAEFTTPPTACAGAPVQFQNNSSVATCTWNFGDGSSTVSTLSPSHTYASSGSYFVTLIASSNGCQDSITHVVQVYPLPVVNFSSSTVAGCDSLNVFFTNVSSGGTSYAWSFGDGGASSSPTPSHLYTTPGVYTVELTVQSSYGCSSSRSKLNLITIRPSPSPSILNTTRTICLDDCISFTGSSTGSPSAWNWSFQGGRPGSSFGSSVGAVCYDQSGNYDVTLTVNDGYCTGTTVAAGLVRVVDCFVSPTADFIFSDSSVCSGSCLSFVSMSLNSTLWNWSFPGATPSTSSLEQPTGICYTTPGVYPVRLVAMNPTGSDTLELSNVIHVTAPPPIPSFTQSGNTLTAPAGYSYQWYYNSIPISGATLSSYTATLSGNYSVEVTDVNGCSAVSQAQHVSLVGITELADVLDLSYYPNPFIDQISVELFSSRSQILHVYLTDDLGREVFSKDITLVQGPNTFTIQMGNIASGPYLLNFVGNGRLVKRLVNY